MTTKARLVKEGETFLQRVLKANEDLETRLRNLSMCIAYDRDDDTFMLTLGQPAEALTESLDGGRLYVRIDPETLSIVGVEVPDLTLRLGDTPAVKSIWQAARDTLGPCASKEVRDPVKEASERLARELRRLLAD